MTSSLDISVLGGIGVLLAVALLVGAWLAMHEKARAIVKTAALFALSIVACILLIRVSTPPPLEPPPREPPPVSSVSQMHPFAQESLPAVLDVANDDAREKPVPEAEHQASTEADKGSTEPPAKPDWVGTPARKVGNAYQVPIVIGPYADRAECEQHLLTALQTALKAYASEYAGPEAAGRIRLPVGSMQEEVVKTEWEERKLVRISPEGQVPEKHMPMLQLHLLLEFDRAANARIDEAWDRVVVDERLIAVGLILGALLLTLSTVYAYLKVDLITGGAYRGRLRLAATVAVLAVVGFFLISVS